MNINAETYSKMRIWENIRGFEIQERKRIIRGEKLELDPWDLLMGTEEEAALEHRSRLLLNIKEGNQIYSELLTKGVDVEHAVTSFYTNLRRGFWLHNYYIEEIKKEFEGYEYQVYEHEHTKDYKRDLYDTLETAISTILSYYEYQPSNPKSVEEVIRTKWDIIV